MSDNVFQALKIRAQFDPVVRRKLAAYPLEFLANFDLSFDENLKNSQPVVVHCEAGLGRTGTIIAGYLTTCGHTAQEAIDFIRRLRPGSVETEEQEAVIYAYERISVERPEQRG